MDAEHIVRVPQPIRAIAIGDLLDFVGDVVTGDRRRCVVPKTERLHQVQVYGQPRAVISETGPNP